MSFVVVKDLYNYEKVKEDEFGKTRPKTDVTR